MAKGDQSVSFSIEGTRLVIKIGAHCRALVPGDQIDVLTSWLLRESEQAIPNKPASLTLRAYRVVNS